MLDVDQPKAREEIVADAGLKLYAAAVQEASELSVATGMPMADALGMARVALARAVEFVDLRLASEKR